MTFRELLSPCLSVELFHWLPWKVLEGWHVLILQTNPRAILGVFSPLYIPPSLWLPYKLSCLALCISEGGLRQGYSADCTEAAQLVLCPSCCILCLHKSPLTIITQIYGLCTCHTIEAHTALCKSTFFSHSHGIMMAATAVLHNLQWCNGWIWLNADVSIGLQ